MRRPPPKKKKGQGKTPRRFAGELRDIATQAEAWGISQKCLRSQIARSIVPFRRIGRGRIVFVASELSEFLRALPGVSPQEAVANMAARQGEEPTR